VTFADFGAFRFFILADFFDPGMVCLLLLNESAGRWQAQTCRLAPQRMRRRTDFCGYGVIHACSTGGKRHAREFDRETVIGSGRIPGPSPKMGPYQK
jgi:hypothetical protein